MLKKIMKYEWRAVGRTLWPVAGLSLALAVLIRAAIWVAPKINKAAGDVVLLFVEGLAPSAASIILFAYTIVLAVRFYQSLSANEAYLSFTLPVKVSTHLFARLWVAVGYTTIYLVVAGLFCLIAIPSAWEALSGIWQSLPVDIPMPTIIDGAPIAGSMRLDHGIFVLIAVLGVLSLWISQVCSVLQLYASVAIGTQFGRSRSIGTVVAYFASNLAQGIVTLIVLAAVCVPMILGRIESYTPSAAADVELMWWVMGMVALAVGLVYLIFVLFGVGYFLLSKRLFTKKLNLE